MILKEGDIINMLCDKIGTLEREYVPCEIVLIAMGEVTLCPMISGYKLHNERYPHNMLENIIKCGLTDIKIRLRA